MNDFNDQHAPTPEFRASLKRELLRTHRADRQFGPPPAPRPARSANTRRLGMAIGLAMGGLVTLSIGLVLGARTGYASAAVLDARQRESTTTTIERPNTVSMIMNA